MWLAVPCRRSLLGSQRELESYGGVSYRDPIGENDTASLIGQVEKLNTCLGERLAYKRKPGVGKFWKESLPHVRRILAMRAPPELLVRDDHRVITGWSWTDRDGASYGASTWTHPLQAKCVRFRRGTRLRLDVGQGTLRLPDDLRAGRRPERDRSEAELLACLSFGALVASRRASVWLEFSSCFLLFPRSLRIYEGVFVLPLSGH